MSQDQINQLLQQGIAAARANRPDVARGILQQVLQADPRNEVAWAWLASIARDNRERLIFLRKLLEVNPQNEFALKGLRALGVQPEPTQPQGPPSAVPYIDDRRFAAIQQATDEFLRSYTTTPEDHLNIDWEQRQRNRYGEGGAKRLQQVIYAGATVAVLAVVAVFVLIVSQLDISLGGDGESAAMISTAISSATPRPTYTPTIGGPTPTDFPENLAFAATVLPPGLTPGDPDALKTPTAIVPRPDLDVEFKVLEAADYYAIGDYDTVIDLLSRQREIDAPACYPSVVYYEALSHAYNGDLDEANSLLDWASNHEPELRSYHDCLDSPLIMAGFAEIYYLENPQSDAALNLSVQALDENPDLIPAVLIKGRVELAKGQLTTAWQTVHTALDDHPQDTNLLLLAAEIELANEEPAVALEYIGQALYIDPDLLTGLYLQAEAYLQLAGQATTITARRQGYGLAVRSAWAILEFYQGDVRGYLYLAKARLGEGNDDLAEDALKRILEVEDDLPNSADPVIDEAYLMLGNLYFAQGRFTDAQAPLNAYVGRRGLNNPEVVEKLVYSAMGLSEYAEASEWLNRLLALPAGANNAEYRLLEAQLLVETCAFYPQQLSCDYDSALTILTDTFINSLQDETQRARALTYRAQARYHDTLRQGAALSESQQQTAFQQARTDIAQALSLHETAIAHYYNGLLLEALGEPVAAFEEYQWVAYWDEVYDYPFVDADFQTRLAATRALAQGGAIEEIPTLPPPLPTSTPDITIPTETPTPRATNTPQATSTPRPTNTPQATDTPSGPTPTPGPTDTPSPTPTITATPVPTDIPSGDIP